ncbi:alanine racemase [Amaricoccus solimangrovi]|uniref:Alanine racemase n=1 Tax=Amaricoccus solimangrovi TaxID=2589815 RepID=A0A501WXW8_9RHOB|nr:alanine racemase [Amaricoccus solimangrovi]TPE50746.1 alanine racemase [Amaricoccus solimangrovi]
MARARLTIDLDAIASNWRALASIAGPRVETAAVLKADAYGLGADRVGPALAAAGARSFFVALAEEGAALRAALGPGPSIRVLGGLMPGDAALCREATLTPCLNSPAQLAEFEAELPGARCALQIDSGMRRLGFAPAELTACAGRLRALRPDLVMSHLACADVPGHPCNAVQLDRFTEGSALFPGVPRSLAATPGTLLGPAWHFDLVRPGIGLFGGLPFAAALPVVRLALPVIQTRAVAPGEPVGYGAAWTAERPSVVATVSGGYADGLLRAIASGGVALYAGETACPLIGRVSMDLLTVDVTDLAEVPAELEILNAHQGVDDLARAAGTIGYEILTSLGDRYERVYKGAASRLDPA